MKKPKAKTRKKSIKKPLQDPKLRAVKHAPRTGESQDIHELGLMILKIKQSLFAMPRQQIVDVVGADALRQSVRLLRKLQKRIQSNGWRYHIPQPHQVEFHRSYKRLRLVLGGNRSGKTISGVWEGMCFAMGNHPYKPDLFVPKGAKIVVASQTTKTMREYLNDYIFKFLPENAIDHISYIRNEIIDYIQLTEAYGGRRITLMSYDQGRKRFQGFSAFAAHLDEEPPEDIWQEILPRLMDQKGYLWMTLTPLLGMSYVYDTLYLNPDKDPEYEDFEWDVRQNATLDPDEVERILSKYPEEIREARASGKFMGLSGRVYPWLCRPEAYYDPFPIPDGWLKVRVIDPSASGVTCCLWVAVDPFNNLWVYDEYYAKNKTVEDHCASIRLLSRNDSYFYDLIDGASLAASVQAKGGLETTYDLYVRHLYRDGAKSQLVPVTEKSIEDGIAKVWEYHSAAEQYVQNKPFRHPYLRVSRSCKWTQWEALRYRWAEFASGARKGVRSNSPVHKDCHAMDCMRYLCHYGVRYVYQVKISEREAIRWRDPVTNY